MMTPTTKNFWLSYFTSTEDCQPWLRWLTPEQKTQMLETLMQWEDGESQEAEDADIMCK
ncbi:hypothetical protein TUM12370_31790 [Salmonella enterica subsp. enterica serovar Choleraesuis]|nr:hypothetical protein TUM12370_31790 [Salmonella enterica subsp. enterica serovar Choleraesuis]